jgi:hypothetical protein
VKRSTQIGLFLVGTLGVTSASGYYLMNRDEACRKNPDRTDQDCRHSGSSHGGSGSGRPLFGSSSTSQTSSASSRSSSTSSQSSSAQRSGFGATGRALGLSGS